MSLLALGEVKFCMVYNPVSLFVVIWHPIHCTTTMVHYVITSILNVFSRDPLVFIL